MGGFRRAIIAVGAVALATASHAQTQQLPPGAQPGAAQPRDLTAPIPEAREPFEFRIPPMIERPLGVDEGARVFVHAFELRGILDDPTAPQLGAAARERVQREFRGALELVEDRRMEAQRLGEVGPDGFTAAERERIVDFMARAAEDRDPERRIVEYNELVAELGLARLERQQGLTIGQIQQVADAVTELYQENGYFLARAIVPSQDVVDGVVVIQVLEGRMGRARAENNNMYSERILVRPFAELEGQLITAVAMEDALLTLSDYPGLQAFGTFRPGEGVGTADIVVNVQDESRLDFGVLADNHGTRFTGKYRLAATASINNLFGRADRATLTGMRTFDPDNTTLGSFNYTRPLLDQRTRLFIDLSRNAFDITGAAFAGADLGGVSRNALIGFEQAFARSRHFNLYGQLDVARKRGQSSAAGTVINQDDLAVFGLQMSHDRIIARANAIESSFFRVDRGADGIMGVPTSTEVRTPGALPHQPSRIGAVPEFTKATAGYSRLKAVSPRNTVLLRFAGQWTDDLLPSLEQFSVGGPNQVRALPVSQYLGDTGFFVSGEWMINFTRALTMSVFYDFSRSYTNEPLRPEDRRFSAAGWGLSAAYNLPGRFDIKLQHAWLQGGAREGTGETDPLRVEDSTQTWAEISFRF